MKSHGYAPKEKAKRPPEYDIWCGIKKRCYNPNYKQYGDYGGRGIKVDERWLRDFQAFLDDVGHRPTPRHTLDRFPNNDGDYAPGNVRWATRSEQARNTSRNVWVEIDGKAMIAEDAAIITGLCHQSVIKKHRGNEPIARRIGPKTNLTSDQKTAVRRLLATGLSQAKVAKIFGVSQSHVWALSKVIEIAP